MLLITFETAAKMLGVSAKTVDRMCDRGDLDRVEIPGPAKTNGAPGRAMQRVDEQQVTKKIASWTKTTRPKAPARLARAKKPAASGRGRRSVL